MKIYPNKIYNSLFPNFSDPLSKFNNIKGIGKTLVGVTYNLSKKECAQNCLGHSEEDNKKCNYFDFKSSKNQCSLYSSSESLDINKNKERGIKKTFYKRNTNSSCNNSKDCKDCSSICNDDLNKNFQKMKNDLVLNETNKLGQTLGVNNLESCMQSCFDNKNCNAFLYKENQSKCSMFNEKSKGNNEIYEIKKNLGNKIDLSLEKSYSDYQKGKKYYNGKVGDYFCKFDENNNKCNVTSAITCKNEDKKKIKKIDIDIPNIEPDQNNVKFPLRINNLGFSKCIRTKNGCVGNPYTFNNLGYPQYVRTPNPPTENYMFSKQNTNDKKKDTYIYDVKKFVNKNITNNTPLYSNLVRILIQMIKNKVIILIQMDISELKNSFNSPKISISNICKKEFGNGYVAHPLSLCKKLECKNTGKNKKYRYPCTFDLKNNLNIYNINKNSCKDGFTNSKRNSKLNIIF